MDKVIVVNSSRGILQRKKWKRMNHNTQQHGWISKIWCWGKEIWHERALTAWVHDEVQKQAKANPNVRSLVGG